MARLLSDGLPRHRLTHKHERTGTSLPSYVAHCLWHYCLQITIVVKVPHGRIHRLFGLKLRELREASGMSQEDLADAAALHRTHVSLIERGQRSVRLETVERLARALQIQPAQLMPR